MSNHFIFVRALDKIANYTKHLLILGKVSTILNVIRHKSIMSDICPYLRYGSIQVSNNVNRSNIFSNIIWFFWLQGPQSMPLIVRKCYESLKRNSGRCKIIFIDKYNVKKYAKLPKYIYYKTDCGLITFTEFSDILRCNLLKNYGGIWSDATNFLISNLNVNYFNRNKLLITSGCPTKYKQYISTKWTVSLMGGYKNDSLFIFMNYFFLSYWKFNNYLISYNLIDYGLYFAYVHNIGNFRYYVNNKTPYNNPNMFKLIKYINAPFKSHLYNRITQNTHVFKLTYKKHFMRKKGTFYSKLINNKLNKEG